MRTFRCIVREKTILGLKAIILMKILMPLALYNCRDLVEIFWKKKIFKNRKGKKFIPDLQKFHDLLLVEACT